MAAITDPQAVKFANEKVRVTADLMAQLYYTCKALVNDWNATGLSAKITNTADLIVDGAATDGRNPLTGAQATNIITRAMEVIADYEAGANGKLNTVLAVKVNGAARF